MKTQKTFFISKGSLSSLLLQFFLIRILPLSIVIGSLSFSNINAQSNMELTWQVCFGGSDYESLESIIQTDIGYIVLGTTYSHNGNVSNNHGGSDIWITSIDSAGNLLWERTYGGSNTEYATNIIKDNNGFYYFGGGTFSDDGDVNSGNHGGYDRWVVKIDINGNIIWEKCYGGSYIDYGGVLKLLNNGNILVYGATTSTDGDVPINYGYLDDWLMIINTDGDILENRIYGNVDQNNIFDIVQTRDGGFFFASKADIAQGMVEGEAHGLTDVWAVKLDAEMNIEWQKLYGGSMHDYGYQGVLELVDGYIFLASTNSRDFDVYGYHGLAGESDDIWVVRIDTLGNILWQRPTGGYKWDTPSTIYQSEDGGFVIFGDTQSDDGDVSGNHSLSNYKDIWIVKLSAEGELEWQECFGGSKSERIFKGIIKKSEYNYVIAGRTEHNSGDVDCYQHGEEDFWIFEIKDCTLYQPQMPTQATGPDTLCYTLDSASVYTIGAASGAWGYTWQLQPEEAGTLTVDTLKAYIKWNQVYEGQANISVQSYNDCGESEWSPIKNTWVYNCVGLEEFNHSGLALKVYPNPAKDKVVFELNNFTPTSKANIFIRDITGRPAAQIAIQQKRTSWACEGLEAGVYFYSLQIGNGNISGKVLLQ
jgi:Secretion system C-terminal sorting domain/PKD-like domain